MASTAPPSDPYFSEIKKGEVGEIRALLRNPALDRDPQRKREVLKKVIAYMTMGIDMSRLFSDMILVRCHIQRCFVECMLRWGESILSSRRT